MIDQIKILGNGNVEVREVKKGEDGMPFFHRYVLHPNNDIENQPTQIKELCRLVWTEEIIANYQASLPQLIVMKES